MEQDRFARRASAPEAATDEPASPANQEDSGFPPQAGETEASPREQAAVPPPPNPQPGPPGPEPDPHDPRPDDDLPFDAVPLRYRCDGLTPERQREYVEALADTGLARAAAARIGVSEQAVARVRRRADARAFDLACEAARRIGARRLHAVAWERAVEGTVKRHYYHGELRSEETVFDNRLLIYLLGKTAHLVEPPAEAEAVLGRWDAWMGTIEQGLAAPPEPEPEAAPEEEEEEPEPRWSGMEVWEEEEDEWWTDFPPPAGFDGIEHGRVTGGGYKRMLSEDERRVIDDAAAMDLVGKADRRDRYFGFEGGLAESVWDDVFGPEDETEDGDPSEEALEPEADEPLDSADRPAPGAGGGAGEGIFSSREAETNETSETSGAPGGEGAPPDPPDRPGPRVLAL